MWPANSHGPLHWGSLPIGIQTYGDIGLIAHAKLAVADSSATRFNDDVNDNGEG